MRHRKIEKKKKYLAKKPKFISPMVCDANNVSIPTDLTQK